MLVLPKYHIVKMQKMQIRMSTRKSQKPTKTNFNCNHNKCGAFVLKRQQHSEKPNSSKAPVLCVLLSINYAHAGNHSLTKITHTQTKTEIYTEHSVLLTLKNRIAKSSSVFACHIHGKKAPNAST